jgi:GTPase
MQVAPAEIEDGCIEYKRNFMNINNSKLNHLTAQMNWRINEGNGICYYYLGICDNGTIYENFSQEDIDYSLDIIKLMCDGCNAYIDSIIIHRSILQCINYCCLYCLYCNYRTLLLCCLV